MNCMVTSDPMNVHHIMSKSFDNYVKGGPEFREIFQAFGDGYDPKSLSIEFSLVEVEKAFDEIEESIYIL
ncbi:hypothetical protein AHAS_Ahas05G0195300 [Arachis hypogaea]